MKQWTQFSEFIDTVASYSNPHCLNNKEDGKWRSYTNPDVVREIRGLALGLNALGLKEGDRVGLMAPSSPRWMMVNMAVILAGGVLVPLFPNLSDENLSIEVEQTKMRWIFVDRELPLPNFEQQKGHFEHIIEMKKGAGEYEALLSRGEALDAQQPHLFDELKSTMKPENLAAIIYTSGSTGVPKGVELTQLNLLGHLHAQPWDIIPSEARFLSILPLAHIFGYSINFIMLGWGAGIYYSNDVKNLGEVCKEVHPTITAVVPRVLEKIYAKMLSRVHGAGFMKRHLGQWAFDLANQEEDSLLKHILHPIVDKLVYATLREALGGSLTAVICGGAALSPQLNHFFEEIGVPIYQGWGMTEGCPVTVNSPEKNKIGTVGRPFEGIQLKISPEGEVLVKGSLVMRGYFLDLKKAEETIDAEGWLHTGDKGKIDAEGFLTLQGRLKELLKTSTGEYVAPVPIEQTICKAPLIEMAMVVADGKKFASCLLFPNKEVLESLKKAHQQSNMSDEEFLKGPFVRKEMLKLFAELNRHLNHWEQIHAYRFIPENPTVESGELTPTLKIRRDAVGKKYAAEIEAMYAEGGNV